MDFAELVMTAKTKGLKDGEDALDDLVDAGDRAEEKTKSQTDGMGRSYSSFASTAGKAIGGLVAGISAYQIAASGLAEARSFDAALAETSTLIEGTGQELDYLEAKAVSLARTFGTDATQQVSAFYQAISAGAASVEDAGVTLEAANKLAEGGITSVSTAVGVLSGVVNTYGKDVINVEGVSDALFVGMRAGVTTVDQLAASIGVVLPLANAMGLSFDETVAATAALTKNNLSTSAAVTSLNAALTAVSGPTTQAQELAASLGLEFNSAALEAKGFGAFMADVTARTGGSVDAMRTLFGSVEGMKAALLFAGEAGGQFNDIMDDMADKVGQTDEAVAKINSSLSDRMDDSLARLGIRAMEFGQLLLAVAVPALEATVFVIDLAADNVEVLGVALAFLAASQIPVAIGAVATLATGFTTMTAVAGGLTKAVGFLRVAMIALGGPIGLLLGAIGAASAAFLLLRDDAHEAEDSMYDAKAGSEELNKALNDFTTSGAPAAGAAAIDLANDNYRLADSAYAAAEAELAKARAMIQAFDAGGNGLARMQSDESRGRLRNQMQEDEIAAIARLDEAEAALQTARDDRNRASRTVTGSDFSGISPVNSDDDGPSVRPSRTGGGGGKNAALEEYNALQDEGKSITESLRTEQERLNDALEQADRLFAVGALSSEAYVQHTANLRQELADVEFGPMIDGLTEISDGMLDAIMNGDNLLESFVRILGEMALEAAKADIGNAISGLFGGSQGPQAGILGMGGGDSGGGGIGGLIGSFFGGFRANGGGVEPSKAYMVGEDGPELFKPDTVGTIVPNSMSGPASQRAASRPSMSPNVNVEPKVEVVVLDDPRKIDEQRTSPRGERERRRADRRLQDA